MVERWSESVVWQLFSGMEYDQIKLPCDATQIGRFRRVLGEAGVEQLLKTTIEAAVAMKAVKPVELERVTVDTTVQEKALAHPTDSRLLDSPRASRPGRLSWTGSPSTTTRDYIRRWAISARCSSSNAGWRRSTNLPLDDRAMHSGFQGQPHL